MDREPLVLRTHAGQTEMAEFVPHILAYAGSIAGHLAAPFPAYYRQWKALQRLMFGLESLEWPGAAVNGGDDAGLTHYFGVQSGFALVCQSLVGESLWGSTSFDQSLVANPVGGRVFLSAVHCYFTAAWTQKSLASAARPRHGGVQEQGLRQCQSCRNLELVVPASVSPGCAAASGRIPYPRRSGKSPGLGNRLSRGKGTPTTL